MSAPDSAPVVVVTGGGGGIGAAIAIEAGRRGAFVVTVDPLVSVDGTELLTSDEDTTAARIVAAGGQARASGASVTDVAALRDLLDGLVDERGRLDAVVNVAGITRPTGFAKGTEEDWAAVLDVHLDGYVNVLDAALPIMARAGRGQILGVTSGSGWRAADAGAYSCAKRAVAALTWQVGRVAPVGVTINAISPIAMTRMVTAALARAGSPSGPRSSSATGGLALAGMPDPEDLGPLGAGLVSGSLPGLRGQVLFAGGSEVAVVEPPRLMEVVRTSGVESVAEVLRAVTPAWAEAEAAQATTGGSNPRFGGLFDEPAAAATPSTARNVVVVTDRTEVAHQLSERLTRGGALVEVVDDVAPATSFATARAMLDAAAQHLGGTDALIVAIASSSDTSSDAPWAAVVGSHVGLAEQLRHDAGWARAAAEHAADTGRPLRLVTLVDAADAGGRSRAQASAQLARAAARATDGAVRAVAVSVEDRDLDAPSAELAAMLATEEVAEGLLGAELVVGHGWMGLRSHPRPGTSIVYGGPDIPGWFGTALGDALGIDVAIEEGP